MNTWLVVLAFIGLGFVVAAQYGRLEVMSAQIPPTATPFLYLTPTPMPTPTDGTPPVAVRAQTAAPTVYVTRTPTATPLPCEVWVRIDGKPQWVTPVVPADARCP